MNPPELWLGTALWGWGVSRVEAFAMLDQFAQSNGVWVDTATNYPINGVPADFGVAGSILSEWLIVNRGSPIRVMSKVGALDNSGGSSNMLDGSAVMLAHELAMQKYGSALGGICIHWDNRDNSEAIAETVGRMQDLDDSELRLGLSGIRNPELYYSAAPDLNERWWIQVKDNIQTREAYDSYATHLENAHYIAYGINMGGVKSSQTKSYDSSLSLRGLDEPDVAVILRSRLANLDRAGEVFPRDLADLALIRVLCTPRLHGCIVGPRNPEQLKASLACWEWAQSASTENLEPAKRLLDRILADNNVMP